MNAEIIGKRIRELREDKGISMEKFSSKVGISVSALSMYETGKRIPRDEVKLRISRFLGATIEDIFFAM